MPRSVTKNNVDWKMDCTLLTQVPDNYEAACKECKCVFSIKVGECWY